jgi:hypothetical protein
VNDFFVDLLPEDARRLVRQRAHMRLFRFGAALMATVAVGVVTSSFVELRNARAEHSVIVSMRDRASKVDELLAAGLREAEALSSELAADSLLRSPVTTTEVVATIANLMPTGSWLESLRMGLDEPKSAKGAPPARPSYLITMTGRAPTADGVQALAAGLRRTMPFAGVTIVEQRAAPKASGGVDQQFVMRLRVNPAATTSEETVVTRARNDRSALEVNQ